MLALCLEEMSLSVAQTGLTLSQLNTFDSATSCLSYRHEGMNYHAWILITNADRKNHYGCRSMNKWIRERGKTKKEVLLFYKERKMSYHL